MCCRRCHYPHPATARQELCCRHTSSSPAETGCRPCRSIFDRALEPFAVNRHRTVSVQVGAHYTSPEEADSDAADPWSYIPISNLPALSKLLERIVFRQLYDYLSRADLQPSLQSAYRSHRSTETAVLKVLTDILYAVDDDDLSVLALLDLSAAFDTVDHDILLTHLRVSYGVGGAALDWIQSYLTHRVDCVRRGSDRSTLATVWFGVPQGLSLAPTFILYIAGLIELLEDHSL